MMTGLSKSNPNLAQKLLLQRQERLSVDSNLSGLIDQYGTEEPRLSSTDQLLRLEGQPKFLDTKLI